MAALPHVFGSGFALTTMSLMGTMIIFALSYNMLLGQTGLLSFGHAVFFGLGGFLTAHVMNAVETQRSAVAAAGVPAGRRRDWPGVRRHLWLGVDAARRHRLRHDLSGHRRVGFVERLILRHFFGGEEGITTDRTKLIHPFGLDLRAADPGLLPDRRLVPVSVAAMYALTRTPFGRICNAVRDNPERARFIGYSTQTVRFICFSLSGLFAGIAGGLAAVNFEIANSAQMGAT